MALPFLVKNIRQQQRKINGCRVRCHDVSKAYVHGHFMNNAVHICREEEPCTRIFLFHSDRLHRYVFRIKRNAILITGYAQYFLEHLCQELSVTAYAFCHEVHVYGWASVKAIHRIEQRTAFKQKVVLVLTYRYPVQQSLVEVSCKKIHIFIACLVHQIEQTSLDRLAIVLLSHFILLLFQDNYSKYWQPSAVLRIQPVGLGCGSVSSDNFVSPRSILPIRFCYDT